MQLKVKNRIQSKVKFLRHKLIGINNPFLNDLFQARDPKNHDYPKQAVLILLTNFVDKDHGELKVARAMPLKRLQEQ